MADSVLPPVTVTDRQALEVPADVLVLGVRPGADLAGLSGPLALLGFRAEKDQIATVPAGDLAAADVVVAVALPESPTPSDLRAAAARGLRAAPGSGSVAIALEPADAETVAAVVEGARLAGYRYDRYKTSASASDDPAPREPRPVTVVAGSGDDAVTAEAVARSEVVTEAVARARDWVNTPPGDLRPADFAAEIAAYAGPHVAVTTWDEEQLLAERCGGILGVGRGSDAPPRLVALRYEPEGATSHLALVGKGITFDSGGLSIKTGAGMKTMKIDMAGAAAVVATTVAIARLGLPIRVSAWACLAENMPSGSATRPGDVLTMRNGTTVEVHNTDAEGRLVLGDGLALAVESGADRIIDVATLTGACMVALGERTTGVLTNDEAFSDTVLAAARAAGEPMWPLPITPEIGAAVKTSSIADLRQHNPKPYGGTLYAAAFLREFVGSTPWVHLDIAGPSFNDGSAYDEIGTGGTGVAVRTLVRLAAELAG